MVFIGFPLSEVDAARRLRGVLQDRISAGSAAGTESTAAKTAGLYVVAQFVGRP